MNAKSNECEEPTWNWVTGIGTEGFNNKEAES
jgi:hypothetical protein